MDEHMQQHTKIMSLLGEVKAVTDMTRLDIKRLDDRINGSFKAMTQHVNEGVEYRNKIIRNESGVWWMRLFYVALLIPMLFLVYKTFV